MDPQPQTWWNWALGACMAIVMVFVNAYRRKIDDIADTYVSREELERYLADTRAERRDMHKENIDRLDRLADDIGKVHMRVDRWYSERRD